MNKGKLKSILELDCSPLAGPDSGPGFGSTKVPIRRNPVSDTIHVSFFETVAGPRILFGRGWIFLDFASLFSTSANGEREDLLRSRKKKWVVKNQFLKFL